MAIDEWKIRRTKRRAFVDEQIDEPKLRAAFKSDTRPCDELQRRIQLLLEALGTSISRGLNDKRSERYDVRRQLARSRNIFRYEPQEIRIFVKPVERAANLFTKPFAGLF